MRLIPVGAARQDHGCQTKSFYVIDDGGLVPQTVGYGEGRLVSGFGAFAFDGLEQSTLLAADVAAGADEYFQIKSQVATENSRSQQALLVAAIDLVLQNIFRLFVFVADIQDPFLRSGNQAGCDHALNYQIGNILHDAAVFYGAGFAFIGVTDDVFRVTGRIAH